MSKVPTMLWHALPYYGSKIPVDPKESAPPPGVFTGHLLSPQMYDLVVGYKAAFRLFISVLFSLTQDAGMNISALLLVSAQGSFLFCPV